MDESIFGYQIAVIKMKIQICALQNLLIICRSVGKAKIHIHECFYFTVCLCCTDYVVVVAAVVLRLAGSELGGGAGSLTVAYCLVQSTVQARRGGGGIHY